MVMFSKVSIQNFGPFTDLTWDSRDRINLLIGANDTGKTYLLKILYCLAKSLEEEQTALLQRIVGGQG